MEAQITELIALLAEQIGVIVDLRGVDLIVKLHFPCPAGFHFILASLDLGPQLRTATALLFAVNGFVLYSACRYPEGRKNGERILVSDAAVVGVSRLAAVFPGLSSLGNSLAFGKFRGFEHEYNLRFAYLLTLSFQTVSVLYHLIRAVAFDSIAAGILPLLVSMAAAAAVGYLAIQLMRYLFEQGRVYVFSYYCWDATALILILALIRA